MSFCTQCGATVTGKFCTSCGATVGERETPTGQPAPVPPAVPHIPQSAPVSPVAPAAPKKRGPLFYGLIGCGALLVIGVLVTVAGGLFIAHKAKQAGIDPELAERNPTLAAAKMMIAVNPNLELVSSDDDRGTVTIREKKTGKTITVNMQDIKSGRLVFEGDNGERVEVQGGESGARISTSEGSVEVGAGKLPSWVPAYPGAKLEGGLNANANGDESGTATLRTRDTVERVAAFYEQGFKNAGMTVEKETAGDSGNSEVTITGKDESGRRNAAAVISKDGSETRVGLTFETAK